jgi:hypothetical protein
MSNAMRTAFLKLIHTRPRGGPAAAGRLRRFLSSLFASEPDLTRLSEHWDQGDIGKARHRWMDHRIATGHVPVILSAMN